MKTFRHQNISLRIYRRLSPAGKPNWRFSFYALGRRVFRSAASEAGIREKARAVCEQLAAQRPDLATLSPEDFAACKRALQLSARTGQPLELFVALALEAWLLLNAPGRPPVALADAARYYVRSHPVVTVPTCPAAVAEFLADKELTGTAGRHLGDLRARLKLWATMHTGSLADLTAAGLAEWFTAQTRARQWSGTARNHYRAALANFLGWCASKYGTQPPDALLAAVIVASVPAAEKTLWSLAEARALLAAATPEELPYTALSLFSMMRQSEIQRLRWEDLRWDTAQIYVRSQKVKKKSHGRMCPLPENLAAWLLPYRLASGKVCPAASMAHRWTDLCRRAGVAVKVNAGRHTAISARFALEQNWQTISAQSGTDAATLAAHYVNPQPRTFGEAWFGLTPGEAGKIVRIA